MANDMEMLARALLGSKDGAKILANLDRFQKILSGQEGKKLLAHLAGGGGDALKRAAESAKDGDTDAAKKLLSTLLQTKEGAKLISQIIDVVKET